MNRDFSTLALQRQANRLQVEQRIANPLLHGLVLRTVAAPLTRFSQNRARAALAHCKRRSTYRRNQK